MAKEKKPHRVLFVSYNGIREPHIRSQAIPYMRELSKRGMRFTLLTFEKPGELPSNDREALGREKRELSEQGVDWHWLRYHKRPSFLATLWDILRGFLYCAYLFPRRRIELVDARAIMAALMVYPLCRLLRVPFVFNIRGLMGEEYVDAGRWAAGSLTYRLTSALERRCLKGCDAAVVLTRALRREIEEGSLRPPGGPPPVRVIPCCVDPERFRRRAEAEDAEGGLTFLYAGSVGGYYLVEEMLRFFERAQRLIPDARLLFLANNDLSGVEKALTAGGLPLGKVKLARVPHEAIPGEMVRAHVGLLFLRQSFARRAMSPIKLAEYLASGLPVVMTPGVGDSEEDLLPHRVGVMVREQTPEGYDRALKEILDLLADGPALRNRCRRVAESLFSLEAGVSEYEALYRSLLPSS